MAALFDSLRTALLADEPVALATIVEVDPSAGESEPSPATVLGAKLVLRPGLPPLGTLGDPDLDRVVARDAAGALELGATGTRHYGAHGEARERTVAVFVESFAPRPRLVIFGAVDFTAALVRVGKILGFHVTVCDARPVFATKARFPYADEVVVDWPDRLLGRIGGSLGPRDAVCVLTHDPKFDVPAVAAALETRAGYLGAMGSRRTHEERRRRLLESGLPAEVLDERLMSPIGLDIGARTPEETAVSIAAEIIAVRTGKADMSLRHAEGPIHSR